MVVVVVVGVNGQSGVEITNELLNRGHKVIGIARDLNKVTKKHENLTLRQGDILSSDVSSLLAGGDVVVSTYSPGYAPDQVSTLVTATTKLIQGLHNNQRLLQIGSAGGLQVPDGTLVINQVWMPDNFKPIAKAHIEALEVFRASSVNWTVLSPPLQYFIGERTGSYRSNGDEKMIYNNKDEAKISYADLAIAMVDEIEKPKYQKQRFTVGY